MKHSNEKIIEVFKIYCDKSGESSYRKNLQEPFVNSGYYFATNSSEAIYLKKDVIALPFIKLEKPDISFLIKPDNDKYWSSKISIEKLKQGIESNRKMVEKINSVENKCNECEGTGETECHCCGSEIECEDCRGSGKINQYIPTGQMVVDSEQIFNLNDKLFFIARLKNLIRACKILGISEVILHNNPNNNKQIFIELDELTIMIMPTFKDDLSKFKDLTQGV